MNLEVTGKLIVKSPTQQVSDKFKKREFVIELTEEINGSSYTNFAKMQLVQNKTDIIDRFNEGDMIKVNFNIKGNKWEKDGKVNYITNLDAWRIEAAGTMSPGMANAQAQGQGYSNGNSNTNAAATNSFYNPSPENVDDLPF